MVREMHALGNKILNDICEREGIEERRFRFGFHLPPVNSIDHIHLHCFIEPFGEFKYDKIVYGWFMKSVESMLRKL